MYKFKHSYTARDAAFMPLIIVATGIVYSFFFSLVITKVAMNNGAVTEEEIAIFAAKPWVNVINMLIGQIFSIGAYLIYSVIGGKNVVTSSTIKGKFRLYPILLVVAITAVCLFGFNYLITIVDAGLVKLTNKPQAMVSVPQGFGGFVVVFIAFAVIPGVIEEFIYRGVVYNGLRKSYNPIISIVVSALIFALIHFSVFQFVYQFIMGLILATICYYTGSIMYGMIFHVINNGLVVTLNYVAPEMFLVENMSAGNIILIVLAALVASAIIVGLFILLKKVVKKYPTQAEVIEEKSEQEQLIENSQGLSEYDMRQLNPPRLKNKTLLILVCCVLFGLWLAGSFL